MRYFVLVLLCALNFTASAQFWQKSPKPVRVDLPGLESHSYNETISTKPVLAVLPAVQLARPNIGIMKLVEASLLKEAKHNMRFHVYNQASYNFSDLATFYVLQNRFSEA